MIESFVADMAKDALMQELGPYIFVGFLSLIMFVGYHVCGRVDSAIERKR